MSNPVGKVFDIEAAYAALFTLLKANGVQWQGEEGDQRTVTTFSRVPVPPDQVPQGNLPVLYLEESSIEITPAVPTIAGRYEYTLRVDLVILVANNGALESLGDETVVPSRELNRAVAAVIGAIQPPYPGAKQNLGGLVDSVCVEGKVERIVGLPGQGVQLSVGIIPVTILTI